MTGLQFRAIRKQAGLTQQQLATLWGRHRDTIIQIEKSATVRRFYADAIKQLSK